MKHKIGQLLWAWLLLLSTVLASACGSDADGGGEGRDDGNKVVLTFTMAVDNATTRATNEGWDDYDSTDVGNAYENAIDLNSLQVFVCKADGTPIDKVRGLAVQQLDPTLYSVTGAWHGPAESLPEVGKVMVFANCASIDKSASPNDVYQLAFSRAALGNIPMWGVTSVAALSVGRSNDLGTIDLLRSMARIKVSLRADMVEKGYALTSVRLNRYNEQGYAVPASFNSVARTRDIRFKGSLHALESLAAEGLDLTAGTAYVPEYANTGDADPSSITVTLAYKDKEERTFDLHFVDYTAEGEPTNDAYDLQRNHSYEFILYKNKETMKVALEVRQWNKRTHDTVDM